VNLTAKQQLKRNVCPLCYSNPTKTYTVPAVTNEDGTISIPAQPVYGIDPNHEPIDGYMAVRTVPGGIVGSGSFVAGIGATGQSFAVPANKKWLLMSLVTDTTMTATVGNRILNGFIANPTGTTVWVGQNSAAIVAAQVGGYDIFFGPPAANNTTVRKQLAAAGTTNVQVTCNCPIALMSAGWAFGIDDSANIDNADSVTFRYTYVEYDA
jgi:hypothetical protein